MSNGTIDLRGNTNFVVLKNLLHQEVVPRTNLAAVDLTVANGLAITGSTLYVNLATTDDIQYGTIGSLVDAATLKVVADSKAPSFTVGDLLENTNGTLNRKRYMDIISDSSITTRSITPIGATAAVTAYVLEPGNAYKLHVASTNKWLATTAAFKASSETWGIEGHIELFVAGTGYVRTDDNVVLTTPLEPDAVNNCVIRFHDGQAHISVEDTVAGYIVVMASGTSNGSLYYGLANNVGEYISVNDTLAGTVIDLGGVTTYNGEKHVVGNGYSDTIVGGTVACANKTTFSNLSLQNVVVTGGTMTLGDAYIPSGSTVAVSGGGLAVERVTGAGSASVIDLNTTYISIPANTTASASGCVFNGSAGDGIFVCEIGASVYVSNCDIYGGGERSIRSRDKGHVYLQGGNIIRQNIYMSNNSASVVLTGSNTIKKTVYASSGLTTCSVTLTSGAILDLTGNTNATPIAPGGGITFEQGGATVKVGDTTASSSYMMDNITLQTGAKLTNTAIVDLGGTQIRVTGARTVNASGAIISGGSTTSGGGGIFLNSNCVANLNNMQIVGCSGTYGGGLALLNGASAYLSGCRFSGNTIETGALYVQGTGGSSTVLELTDCTCEYIWNGAGRAAKLVINSGNVTSLSGVGGLGAVTISSGASIALTSSISPNETGRIEVLTGGCTVNGNAIPAGTYTSIDSNGQPT